MRWHETVAILQLARRAQSSTFHDLTRAESVDLTLLVVTGCASGLAVLFVYLLIIKNVIRERRRPDGGKPLFARPMDIYMFSLLTADLINALGAIMNMRWIAQGKSEVGRFCTAQGVMIQIGPLAFAMSTIVIALATFNMVWRHNPGFHLFVPCIVIAALWVFVGLLVCIPAAIHHKSSDLYWVPEPLWCTIGKGYTLERLWAKYLFLWLALFISILLYIPLALLHRGNITVHSGTWWRFSIHRRRNPGHPDGQGVRHPFFGMIVYPLSNAILIIPYSVVRWIELSAGSNSINSTERTVVTVIFGLSGLTNVLLLLYIRSNVLLFGKEQIICRHCGGEAEP